MNYDQRWILTVSDPRTKKIKIVDFLDVEMSRVSYNIFFENTVYMRYDMKQKKDKSE